MSKLPALKPQEVVKALKRLGFRERRKTGGHLILKHPETGHMTSVPIHHGKDIKKGLLHGILKQADVDIDEFLDKL